MWLNSWLTLKRCDVNEWILDFYADYVDGRAIDDDVFWMSVLL